MKSDDFYLESPANPGESPVNHGKSPVNHGESGDIIRSALLDAGACAVGFAEATTVDEGEWEAFQRWLANGKNAGMDYMHNYPDIRRDPRLLLPGARTVISLAFQYPQAPANNPRIAAYAFGRDYHKVIRKKIKKVLSELPEIYKNAKYRICIDSAPILERYWGVKSGIGYRGRNGAIIVPGYGSFVFLAEVVTALELTPSSPSTDKCIGCNFCIKKCPGRALNVNGEVNCTKCISYLTIEHRGEWDATGTEVMETEHGRNTLFGCDLCLSLCPHNRRTDSKVIPELQPTPEMLTLNPTELATLSEEEYRRRFAGLPLSRLHHPDLTRNLRTR